MKTLTALVAVASLALAACGSSNSSNSSSSTGASSSSKTTSSASGGGAAYNYGGGASSKKKTTTGSASSGSIAIAMHDNFFGTKVITGKPGSTVKVTLTNDGTHEHNFKIDGQKGADADVEPGKTGTATVKIPTSGSVQFYCEYHKGLGMVGTVKPA